MEEREKERKTIYIQTTKTKLEITLNSQNKYLEFNIKTNILISISNNRDKKMRLQKITNSQIRAGVFLIKIAVSH